jgi:cell division inhibitor SepF
MQRAEEGCQGQGRCRRGGEAAADGAGGYLLGLNVDMYGETPRSPVVVTIQALPGHGALGDRLCELAGGPQPPRLRSAWEGQADATVRSHKEFPAYGRTDQAMALRDTWHRTLVYFGLAEEEDPRYEAVAEPEPEAELEDRYRDRPNVRRLQRRRRDEFDDIFADEPRSGRATRPLRPVGGNGRSTQAGDIQVHLVIPKNFNDAQQIADQFKDSIPVILNLQGTDTDLSKRLIDFASGLTYALDGGMQRIADKVFLLTPRNVEVSAEERARLIEKGFFNQS